MSLLHDALKKAEREASVLQGADNRSIDTEASVKSHRNLFVLSAIASIMILGVVYQKFVRKPSSSNPQAAMVSPVPQPSANPQEIDGTKLVQEGASLLKSERYAEAAEALGKAVVSKLTVPEEVEAYNNLGFVLRKLGRNEEAMQRYQKALSLNPECAECRNNLGVLYLSSRDFVEAETHFKEAMRINPGYADPYFHMALLKESAGDFSEARRYYTRYMELGRGLNADFLAKIQERIALIESQQAP